MSLEAMGQALEALRSFSPYDGRNLWIQEPEVDVDAAIMALVRAIEDAIKQEPVAWRYETGTSWDRTPHWRFLESADQTRDLRTVQPLYTAPPKREWVGLSGEDMTELDEDGVLFARYIEAKLKEKNT